MKAWLLLIISLPSAAATQRQRAWRTLKASGAAVLRDGVYVLPECPECRGTLEAVAAEVMGGGGSAWLVATALPFAELAPLFDRSSDYAELLAETARALTQLSASSALEAGKQARKLRKWFDTIAATDFFPGAAQEHAARSLQDLELALARALSPDEPVALVVDITLRDSAAFYRRIWATRRRPWVDRLASAWLIMRFIDQEACFLWLTTPADCPADAVGFDFDGATFSHVGNRVTFETLLASFGLQQPALLRLGVLVHFLDVGGVMPPEAAGVEAVLAGLRASLADDDRLLAASLEVFDGLYAAFAAEAERGGTEA